MSAPNLALVAVVHGRACVLYMDADEGITEHIAAVGEVVALEECGQWPPSVEGNNVLVCTFALVDDGPSDWPRMPTGRDRTSATDARGVGPPSGRGAPVADGRAGRRGTGRVNRWNARRSSGRPTMSTRNRPRRWTRIRSGVLVDSRQTRV